MSDTRDTQINVAQLLKAPIGAVREYDIEARVPGLEGDAQLVQPIVGRIKLTHVTDGVLAQGHFVTEVEVSCDRCLARFALRVEFDLEELFIPVIDVNTGKWRLLDEGEEVDPAILIDDHHILNLEEVFRQAIYLESPMHPKCRVDCQGLCPQCGKDLNEGPCACENDEIDPRWEALRTLKQG